jgi:putative FmdB family regulatory protein
MPTYVYRCCDSACHHEFEEMQKISASPLVTCPECKKDSLRRKPSGGAGLSFKGSGFYGTDYASGPSGESSLPTTKPENSGGCCPCGKNKGGCGS